MVIDACNGSDLIIQMSEGIPGKKPRLMVNQHPATYFKKNNLQYYVL